MKYLNSIGITAYIPPIPKVADDYVPYIFSDEELERIYLQADNLDVSNTKKNPLIQYEFPMVIRLMYGCGLRIGETLALKMKDVDLIGGILIMRHTKGDKQRLVPMNPLLSEILERYCLASHMLEAGVPLVVIKNFLGHSSLQSTQIYAEISQNTVDKHLKEWNERWFSIPANADHSTVRGNEVPDFLR